VDRIFLAQDCVQWRAFVKMKLKLRVPYPSCMFTAHLLHVIRRHIFRSYTTSYLIPQSGKRLGINSRQDQWRCIFSSPPRPKWHWGLTSLLSSGYWDSFPGGRAAEAWSWTHICLVTRSRILCVIPALNVRLRVGALFLLVTHKDIFSFSLLFIGN
jgi:hypothetical protein